MRRYYVYMVRCADGLYYTEMTNDTDRRIWEHNEGIHTNSYTHSRRPVVMVYLSEFWDVWQAMAWENRIKKWNREKKTALIYGQYEKLPELSRTARNWLVYPWQQYVRRRLRGVLRQAQHATQV